MIGWRSSTPSWPLQQAQVPAARHVETGRCCTAGVAGLRSSGRVCVSRPVRGVRLGPGGLDFYLRQPGVASNGDCCRRCAEQRVRSGRTAAAWPRPSFTRRPLRLPPACNPLAAPSTARRMTVTKLHGHRMKLRTQQTRRVTNTVSMCEHMFRKLESSLKSSHCTPGGISGARSSEAAHAS